MVKTEWQERSITEAILIYSAGGSIMSGKKKMFDEAIKKVRNGR